ncbi:hypothetical protein Q1695_013558 [Nippostrongylus brasiliensis]|nr:hypothetical protein Q1695_013558 [Nippostrongylus brasiliensis]
MQLNCPMSCQNCLLPPELASRNDIDCLDYNPLCQAWASANLCATRSEFMLENCKLSCRRCDLLQPSSLFAECYLRWPIVQQKQFSRSSQLGTFNRQGTSRSALSSEY